MLAEYAGLDDGVGVEDLPNIETMQIYPNPVSDKAVVRYQLTEASPVAITIMDLRGRVVMQQVFSNQSEGLHIEELNMARFPAGVYLCRLQTVKEMETTKLVKR